MTGRPRRPGIRGNLRPDLSGMVLRLADTDTTWLGTGEQASLRVRGVYDADDPEDVLVTGCWSGPDGMVEDARVPVRASALPPYARPDTPDRRRRVDPGS